MRYHRPTNCEVGYGVSGMVNVPTYIISVLIAETREYITSYITDDLQ